MTPALDTLRPLADALVAACRAEGRDDLARRIASAAERADSPETVVCVVGEFKQGKSTLVNGLLGVPVSPVDDGLATGTVAIVRHGETVEVTVRRREGGRTVEDRLDPDDLHGWLLESPDGERPAVESLTVTVPNAFLARGLAVVDTPGVGGLEAAHAAATLAFLPLADAVLFVSDASAELTESELRFLGRVVEVCPTVLAVLTKVDLYPHWRRIAEIDAQRLRAHPTVQGPIPTSGVLRWLALERGDAELNAESGFPALLSAIGSRVLGPGRAAAGERLATEVGVAVRQLTATAESELRALASPSVAADDLERLSAARDRLAHLRGPAARWHLRLTDGYAALAASVDHEFRTTMRTILREAEERVDTVDPAGSWDGLTAEVQTDVTEAVRRAFDRLLEGATSIQESIEALLAEDVPDAAGLEGSDIDIATLWTARPITGSPVRTGLGATWGALRGAQGGILTLGMMSSLIGLTVAGPVLIGAAVLFGGRQIVEDRKRQLLTRRQEAKNAFRRFTDDVQFEVGARMRDLARDLQRRTRDTFTERIDELLRTYGDTVNSIEASLHQDRMQRDERATALRDRLATLEAAAGAAGLRTGSTA